MHTKEIALGPFLLGEIQTIAKEFLKKFSDYKVFAIYGEMGAGKTTFIRALCQEMGIENSSSPTFAIVNEYKTTQEDSVYHFDFYRIKKPEELYDIGFEDYVYSNQIIFIEWPEKAPELLPTDALEVHIEVLETNQRRIDVLPPS